MRPLIISTDMTPLGRRNTVHSLTEMLARFIALGFSLEDVIRMATANPASALGMQDALGSLAVGRTADISVLKEETGDWLFHAWRAMRCVETRRLCRWRRSRAAKCFRRIGGRVRGVGCRTRRLSAYSALMF